MEKNRESAQIAANIMWASMIWDLEHLSALSSTLNESDDLSNSKDLVSTLNKNIEHILDKARKVQNAIHENNLPIK